MMRASATAVVLLLALSACARAKRVVVIGAGWGGLSAAHHLAKAPGVEVTLVDAAPKVGGLVRDGFRTPGGREAEAGQHGFWAEYRNIFGLVDELGLDMDDVFTRYAEQGQWSPAGLEAVWPVYARAPQLPTWLAQAVYTRFLRLPPADLASLVPLGTALARLDGTPAGYDALDAISFRELCMQLGVSERAYTEVAEPMVLTGLFAPGHEVSAAAALGMADFFVLRSQTSFDVRWCRGNVGARIFAPWVARLQEEGVRVRTGARVSQLHVEGDGGARGGGGATGPVGTLRAIGLDDGSELAADAFVFALGAGALAKLAQAAPDALRGTAEWRGLAQLRGTACLATRLWFDRRVPLQYSANPAWGFEDGVGTTFFDLSALHAPAHALEAGQVIEVDWYACGAMLGRTDAELVEASRRVLERTDARFASARVIDSAVVRLPSGATWFYPGSGAHAPQTVCRALRNVCFAGDYVRRGEGVAEHGSWSQERAFVSGVDAANAAAGAQIATPIPLPADEPHVALVRAAARTAREAGVLG